MSKTKSSLDYLFGETSLFAWKQRLDGGEVPSLAQIADILEANKNELLPGWFVEHLCKRLRHPDKPKIGRPRSTKSDTIDMFAAFAYQCILKEFQGEKKSGLARGQKSGKNDQTPSERAARIIQANFYKHKDWKAVLNLISSRKWPRLFMID
jgi:hypothetical protein